MLNVPLQCLFIVIMSAIQMANNEPFYEYFKYIEISLILRLSLLASGYLQLYFFYPKIVDISTDRVHLLTSS